MESESQLRVPFRSYGTSKSRDSNIFPKLGEWVTLVIYLFDENGQNSDSRKLILKSISIRLANQNLPIIMLLRMKVISLCRISQLIR
jgi:hypothetical protein